MRWTKELRRIRLAALMGLVRYSRDSSGINDVYRIDGVDYTWELHNLCRNQRYLKCVVVDMETRRVIFEPGRRSPP